MLKIAFALCAILFTLGCAQTQPNEEMTATFNLNVDLKKLQREGVVGEKQDGYIGIVDPSPKPIIEAVVKALNQQRLEEYQRLSKNLEGVYKELNALGSQLESPLQMTAAMTSASLINALEPGMYYQTKTGQWVKK